MLTPSARTAPGRAVTGWKNRPSRHGLEELGQRPVAGTPWFRLSLAEVEPTGGRRLDHYLLRPSLVMLAYLLGPSRRAGRGPRLP